MGIIRRVKTEGPDRTHRTSDLDRMHKSVRNRLTDLIDKVITCLLLPCLFWNAFKASAASCYAWPCTLFLYAFVYNRLRDKHNCIMTSPSQVHYLSCIMLCIAIGVYQSDISVDYRVCCPRRTCM